MVVIYSVQLIYYSKSTNVLADISNEILVTELSTISNDMITDSDLDASAVDDASLNDSYTIPKPSQSAHEAPQSDPKPLHSAHELSQGKKTTKGKLSGDEEKSEILLKQASEILEQLATNKEDESALFAKR